MPIVNRKYSKYRHTVSLQRRTCSNSRCGCTGWRKKTRAPSHCKYSEIPWPNCVEIKNFIALWRHLAKTKQLSFTHIVQINLSITQ